MLSQPYNFLMMAMLFVPNLAVQAATEFQVSNNGSSSYLIDTQNNPDVTLQRGSTYIFHVTAIGHPFWIKTVSSIGKGSVYDTGVTGNGTSQGDVLFTVPSDAPDQLFYNCEFHIAMTGTITIEGPAEGATNLLTLDLTGFSPHVGGLFEMRVVDWSDGKEVGRTRVESVAAADFSVSVPGISVGGSYNVDFYADLNGNGLYDSPGTDHAWRMTVDNVLGDTTLTFAHSVTNFVDIAWPYLLTLDLTGFSPHVGGLFELRVVDWSDGHEVGRTRVESVPQADFSLSLPGLAIGGSYNVDFYADLNGNGLYDSPGTDHAWRMTVDNVLGDTTLTFAHSVTNFVDIAWHYLLTLDLTGFSPHVGGLFELRVVDRATSLEIGRSRVESIPLADFSVSVPGLMLQGSYDIDFYADLNGNGLYDDPPADHAWQMRLDDPMGDTTLTFAHSVTNFKDIAWPYLLSLDLTGFSPHVGGLFEMRVVDLADGKEVGRTRVESVPQADFSVSLPVLAIGGNYNVDFYADLNGNGLYDSPGTDHAWRMTVENVLGDTTLTFAHSVTNFVDIGWPYLLTLDLTGFSPHVGGLFELRVVDWSDGYEVGRTRVESIGGADFSASVMGLRVGGSYNIDFYADLNGNGLYDAPSTDHAWRMTVENVLGDTTLTFAHSVTNFVDIGWNYLLTLDLTGFSPHVGGLFELRVVDESYDREVGRVRVVDLADGGEVGRTRVESVPQADFSVSLPGLAVGGSYNVDFYADLNGNGLYDSPGTDHAWRIALTDVTGDTTLTFAHSVTNFVDIEWPSSPLGVPPSDNGLPDTYYLAQNYPNPFNPTSTIRFDLPHASAGSLIVYDLMGREVVRLMEGAIEAGYHTRVWDGRDSFGRALPSGIFIARLVTPEYTKSIKMVLLK